MSLTIKKSQIDYNSLSEKPKNVIQFTFIIRNRKTCSNTCIIVHYNEFNLLI